MDAIESVVNEVLKHWNEDVKEAGHDQEFILDVKCRDKKFYLNKVDFFEQPIAEMSLYVKGNPTLLLWRKELRMPSKVKGSPVYETHEAYKRSLYRFLFYECIANFCSITKQLILNRDYAEYDIENDRLKADDSANGMIVQTIKAGPFYEPNQDFDVFLVSDEAYFVYTAHDIAKPNNGIAKIDKDACMIKELAKTKIILLDDIK